MKTPGPLSQPSRHLISINFGPNEDNSCPKRTSFMKKNPEFTTQLSNILYTHQVAASTGRNLRAFSGCNSPSIGPNCDSIRSRSSRITDVRTIKATVVVWSLNHEVNENYILAPVTKEPKLTRRLDDDPLESLIPLWLIQNCSTNYLVH